MPPADSILDSAYRYNIRALDARPGGILSLNLQSNGGGTLQHLAILTWDSVKAPTLQIVIDCRLMFLSKKSLSRRIQNAGQGVGLALGLLLVSTLAHATLVVPKSLDELAARSPVVIYGNVTQIEVDPKTGLRTALFESLETVRAPEAFKKQRIFAIPLWDRAIPRSDLIERISGAPELKWSEELVLFLTPVERSQEGLYRRADKSPLFAIDGFHQGKFRVLRDASGVRYVAAWNQSPTDNPLSAQELRQQKTTPRALLTSKRTLSDKDSESYRSLDSLINAVRSAPPPPETSR